MDVGHGPTVEPGEFLEHDATAQQKDLVHPQKTLEWQGLPVVVVWLEFQRPFHGLGRSSGDEHKPHIPMDIRGRQSQSGSRFGP